MALQSLGARDFRERRVSLWRGADEYRVANSKRREFSAQGVTGIQDVTRITGNTANGWTDLVCQRVTRPLAFVKCRNEMRGA